MDNSEKTAMVLIGLAGLYLTLHVAFQHEAWGRLAARPAIPLVDPSFTNTATVRMSTTELKRTGGDVSGVECYACHERKKPMELHYDTNGNIRLPKEHEDLLMAHGRNKRNDACFNCHAQTNMEALVTRDGRLLNIEESSRLCASCHGTTYRDWEAGVHGRISGFWNRSLGPSTRQECVSCHDPHHPAFPALAPAPGPHRLHPPAGQTQAPQTTERSH